MIGVALHLARGLGANTKEIAEHWIETAKSHGAIE
jgi:arginyl-tRNA synthetase